MKATFLSLVLLALALGPSSALIAQETQTLPKERTFGAGLMVGEPTGASLKYWLSDVSALDAVIGVSLDDGNDFAAHADYLYHFNDVIDLTKNRMALYVGGGPRFKVQDHGDDIFGIRTVAGLDYIFDDIPVDVFLEAGPVFDLSPDAEVRYTVGVGARFWF